MRPWHLLSLLLALVAGGFALSAQTPADFNAAQQEARQALERSRQFEEAAAKATDDAARARAEAEAIVARIQASEAEITAAEARVGLVDIQLKEQRAALAERQGPLVRLMAALQAMSRRPPALALVQPGSLDDAVRVRAVLAGTLPRIQARTAAVRQAIERTRTLRAQQDTARQALVDSRAALAGRREALARFEAEQRTRSQGLAVLALRESDRALALGEEARALERQVADRGFREGLEARLAALPGPVLRPNGAGAAGPPQGPVFLLPVEGEVVTGAGELREAGFHARGLTLATQAGAPVRAAAGGRVAYAGSFRSYGLVLILDHGGGWTSVVTGLEALAVRTGQQVARGMPVGRTGAGASEVTVELRFGGRPVPLTALLGA